MDIELRGMLKTAMKALAAAEQLLPKPVMSTEAGVEVAAAHTHTVKAWQLVTEELASAPSEKFERSNTWPYVKRKER